MSTFHGRISRYVVALTLAVMPVLLLSCRLNVAKQQHTDAARSERFVGEAPDTCFFMPTDPFADAYRDRLSAEVYAYYKSRDFALTWPDGSEQGPEAMIDVIRSVRHYGLLPQDYHLAEIEAIKGNRDCATRLRMDALLTDALFTLSSHISNGRLSPVVVDSVLLEGQASVSTAAQIRRYLKSREPDHEGYRMLQAALTVIYDTLNSTDKQMLLEGITSDSIPTQKMIKSLEINLERWRWERDTLGADRVWVNIPAFEVTVVQAGREILRSRVIVGAPRTPTPVFSSAIECFTVYPYWHVPRSIAAGEYLPAIQKNISFIPLNNLDVLDSQGNILRYDTLPWNTYNRNHFPVSLRQREGTDNALGIVKFQFDNPYAVLLHDTNAKGLFRYENRARSHGCIRMEKAVEFALYLAENYTPYTAEQISGYLSARTLRRIDLVRQLPIHIRYFTVTYDGKTLRQYHDVYGHDKQLIKQYYQAAPGVSEKRLGR